MDDLVADFVLQRRLDRVRVQALDALQLGGTVVDQAAGEFDTVRVEAGKDMALLPLDTTFTVDTYRARIKTKLNLENASQLAHEAIRWVSAGQKAPV